MVENQIDETKSEPVDNQNAVVYILKIAAGALGALALYRQRDFLYRAVGTVVKVKDTISPLLNAIPSIQLKPPSSSQYILDYKNLPRNNDDTKNITDREVEDDFIEIRNQKGCLSRFLNRFGIRY